MSPSGERDGEIHQRVLPKKRGPHEREIREARDAVAGPLGELLLRIRNADESRESHTKQGEREASRVLVGVEPDDHARQRQAP